MEDAIEEYKTDSLFQAFPFLFPIFSGDYFLIDLNPESAGYKKIHIFSSGLLFEEPTTIYDGLESMIQTCHRCLVDGANHYDDNEFLVKEFESNFAISASLNPNSSIWKS